jgi:DNA-binding LytR/AlgR family response regulator
LRVVIIEDEPIAASRLEKMLEKLYREVELVSQPDSVKSSVEFFKNNTETIDFVFMDIHLSDGKSFQIFEQVDVDVPIIFTTAYDEYALKAFEVNSIDYLLKPIKEQDLKKAIEKWNILSKTRNHVEENKSISNIFNKQSRIVVRYGSVIKAIEITEAAYFYTSQKVTFMVLKSGEALPIDENLDELESILDAKEFFRINRQYIVSFSAIDSMVAYTKSRVKLNLKPLAEEETIVSTERSSDFKKWLLGK